MDKKLPKFEFNSGIIEADRKIYQRHKIGGFYSLDHLALHSSKVDYLTNVLMQTCDPTIILREKNQPVPIKRIYVSEESAVLQCVDDFPSAGGYKYFTSPTFGLSRESSALNFNHPNVRRVYDIQRIDDLTFGEVAKYLDQEDREDLTEWGDYLDYIIRHLRKVDQDALQDAVQDVEQKRQGDIPPFISSLKRGPDSFDDIKRINLTHTHMEYGASTLFNFQDRMDSKNDVQYLDASVRILQGIAAGLQYIHEQGFAHGHIYEEEILLADDNTPKISEFKYMAKPEEKVIIALKRRALKSDLIYVSDNPEKNPGSYIVNSFEIDLKYLGRLGVRMFTKRMLGERGGIPKEIHNALTHLKPHLPHNLGKALDIGSQGEGTLEEFTELLWRI